MTDYGTILAVPGDRPMIVSQEQGEKILAEIRNKHITQEERENIARDVKIMFTKPGKE